MTIKTTVLYTAIDERRSWLRRGLQLEWLTICWMSVEAAVAIFSGLRAHSITLLAFGVDSVIELISAFLLIWRLGLELRGAQHFSEHTEELASKIAGGLLYALALYIVSAAFWSFIHRTGQEFSALGLSVAVVAIPAMYWLSRRKLRVAEKIGSRALRADAVEAIACGWLSFVVVIGLAAQTLLRVWWVDGVTSLAIVYFLIREGREAWSGDDCCNDE